MESSGHRGALFTSLAMNGESPDMSTIEPTLDPMQAKRQYLLILQVSIYCLLHLKAA